MNPAKIRNFAVIAHIDHGKTTLTDRLIEQTGGAKRNQGTRVLDSHPIEKERGITIKLAPVTLDYQGHQLNLIDTPGHIDFNYEVERSLAACEGALLLVDATQGIQAQTLGNLNLAKKQNLKLIPVINKIDLPAAQVEDTTKALNKLLPGQTPLLVSAKTGVGIPELFENIISTIPSPQSEPNKPLRALVFNSVFHPHLGVVAFVRIVDGSLQKNTRLNLFQTNQAFTPVDLGIFTPDMTPTEELTTGQVGYIATGLKDIHKVHVGDTLTTLATKVAPLPGYRVIKPNLYLDVYPTDNSEYKALLTAVDKIKLHDAALSVAPTSSPSLGHGLQVGFLGLLHSDIFKERLAGDFNLSVTLTSPSVEYKIELNNGETRFITRPGDFPDPSLIKQSYEPVAKVTLLTPVDYLGPLIQLLEDLRGTMLGTEYLDAKNVSLTYELPLIEVITHLHDAVKGTSQGFASVDYEPTGFKPATLVKLTITLNHEDIEPLSKLEVKEKAEATARRIANELKEKVPRHQFEIPIQIKIGGTIVARETVKAFRKDVTAKLYGGDRTRRMKLLEKQKKGKVKMKSFGQVNLPPEVFRLDI